MCEYADCGPTSLMNMFFQVRSKLASLDGIVPFTNGFTIGSSGMNNVWLSMEHQSILWCNQLVVQVSKSTDWCMDQFGSVSPPSSSMFFADFTFSS